MILPDVNKRIDELYFDGALAQRAISVEIEPIDNKTVITAWQCNMASMKTTDLKLPTVLRMVLEDGTVTEADLMENFKGSQGIPCSQKYLDRILKKQLIDIDFGEDDTVLHNELMFHCRHIFELVAASITFYRFCGSDIKKKNTLFDFTKAFQAENGLIVTDEYEINGEKTATKESFIFAPGDISMQKNGKIAAVKKMAVKAETVFSNGEKLDFSDEIHDIEGSNNVIMSVMKLFSGLWKGIGRKIGIRRNFYFTNLLPSSLYGVFIQAVALMVFKHNYNYFQHSLAGLQRSDERPLCVGMVLNMDELKKFYPEFREDDLLG